MSDLKVKDFMPLISALLIILGTTRLGVIYEYYDINILEYLNFGEILTSFLLFSFVILLVVLFFAFFYLLLKRSFPVTRLPYIRNVYKKYTDFGSRRIMVYCHLNSRFIFFNSFVLILIAILSFVVKNFDFLILCLYLPFFIVLFWLEKKRGQKINKRIANSNYFSIFFCLAMLLAYFSSLTGEVAVSDIEHNKRFDSTIIQLTNGNLLMLDSVNYFIGKTQDYIFIRHSNQGTEVISTKSISVIKFLKTRNYSKKGRRPFQHFFGN